MHFIVTFLFSFAKKRKKPHIARNHIKRTGKKLYADKFSLNIWNRRPLVVIALLLFFIHVLFLAVIKQANERNRLYAIEIKKEKNGNEL